MLGPDEQGEERDARSERALTRYLRGERVTDIAADLGVSASTARRWINAALAALAAGARAERAMLLGAAIESQRAIASAAWAAYERERALDEALLRGDLDRVRRRAIRAPRRSATPRVPDSTGSTGSGAPALAADDCPPLAEEEYERPKRSTQGPRYPALALAAQREVARLQGLYEKLEARVADVHITVTERPAGPEDQLPTSDAPAPDGKPRA